MSVCVVARLNGGGREIRKGASRMLVQVVIEREGEAFFLHAAPG
jgi:Na+-transporting NADH:ubiquinone oxidoreductase subunit NqrA